RIELDGRAFDTHIFNVIVNNVPVYAGELEMPAARRDDGLLDVYLFDRNEYGSKFLSFLTKKADFLKWGIHDLIEEITQNQRTFHARSVLIELASSCQIQVDGEALGAVDRVECALAGKVRVALP